jgi:hypothetical protein
MTLPRPYSVQHKEINGERCSLDVGFLFETSDIQNIIEIIVRLLSFDRLCGLVFGVLGYRSGGPGSILGTTRKKVVGLERGPLSLVSTTEELLDRKVAATV